MLTLAKGKYIITIVENDSCWDEDFYHRPDFSIRFQLVQEENQDLMDDGVDNCQLNMW